MGIVMGGQGKVRVIEGGGDTGLTHCSKVTPSSLQ